MPYVDRGEARVFYQIIDVTPPWVQSPPTILFHHGVSTTRDLWSDWIPVLCSRYRLVLFDMRGFGQSSYNPSDVVWSIDVLIDDVLAVAAAANLQKFHLVGESAGGTVAMAMAIANPDRLISLTVSNAAHRGTAVQNVRGVWKEHMASRGQEEWATQMMEWRFFPGSLPDGKHKWFYHQQATCSAEATLAIAELLLRTDLSKEVGTIKVPTLILCPDSSPFVPVEISTDLHMRVANSEMQVFAHSRHGLPFSHSRECAETLRAFLERQFGS